MEVRDLIIQAKKDKLAANELLFYIANRFRRLSLRKYWPLSGIDQDEIGQIFMIGCYEAIEDVDPDVGNPIAFITTKGQWAVADYVRRQYGKQLRQYCPDCGTESRPNRSGGQYACRRCHSVNVELFNPVTQPEFIEVPSRRSEQDEIMIREFRDSLGGRKRDVFDLMIYRGIDRESSRNYIKEIAATLGITPANVNIRLRQIKEEWHKYSAV